VILASQFYNNIFIINRSKPERKSQKLEPESSKSKVEIPTKNSSPENKPLNGQENKERNSYKEVKNQDEIKTLKIQRSSDGKGNEYNPAKKNYHPIDDAFWKRGEK
jgi:hypothetical protein